MHLPRQLQMARLEGQGTILRRTADVVAAITGA
jgi:hypothetical protein